jgi:hypothetical protein
VATGLVVEDFNVLENGILGFSAKLEISSVDQLVLPGVPDALSDRVVVAASATAHAGDHALGIEHDAVVFTVSVRSSPLDQSKSG